MEAEPFLLPLSVQDKAPLPAQGYHGLPPLHTWVALCMLEGLIAGWAGLGTFAFVEDKVYVELKVVLFQALDMGLDSEICSSFGRTRLPSLTLGASSGIP